ncbi:MAG TPA: Ku protein [Terracidiphilus sp.]|nr:Ku protein [Terracidiphilus sp.]
MKKAGGEVAGRPYWSGQMKISLVSFGVQLFPAANPLPGIEFHEIDRETGQRIRHLNVAGEDDTPVDHSEIVKGYEYRKGEYLIVEPKEIANLRVETKRVIEVNQFVDLGDIDPALFEKPYFVVPQPKASPEAFAVMRKAMEQTGKAAIGEIAFGGREHLIAIAAPPDKGFKGLMGYTLRYDEELRSRRDYSIGVGEEKVDKKQLAMATELIRAFSAPLHLDEYKDDYEAALRELIEAKQKNAPLPLEAERPRQAKVVNLMDALRRSVNAASHSETSGQPRKGRAQKKGPMVVKPSRRKRKAA